MVTSFSFFTWTENELSWTTSATAWTGLFLKVNICMHSIACASTNMLPVHRRFIFHFSLLYTQLLELSLVRCKENTSLDILVVYWQTTTRGCSENWVFRELTSHQASPHGRSSRWRWSTGGSVWWRCLASASLSSSADILKQAATGSVPSFQYNYNNEGDRNPLGSPNCTLN